MKKIICIVLSLCFLTAGCSEYKKSSAVTAVTTGLSFTAKLSFEDETYDYSVKIDKKGLTEMKCVSNKDTAYTDYIFENNTVTYKYNELSYKTEINSMPQASVVDFIYTVFNEITKKQNNVDYKNEEYYIKGETEKYKFTIYFGETGLPLKITDSEKDISVIIKNPTLL